MLEKKINLDEIINICINKDYESKYNNICKDSMLEFGKQLLELACENADIDYEGGIPGIDKQTIRNTIKQVE